MLNIASFVYFENSRLSGLYLIYKMTHEKTKRGVCLVGGLLVAMVTWYSWEILMTSADN